MAFYRISMFWLLALMAFGNPAFASVDIVLAPSKKGLHKADAIYVTAYFMNQGEKAEPLEVPAIIPCWLKLDGKPAPEAMQAVKNDHPAPLSLSPGAFYHQDYTIRLPEDASGTARIIPKGFNAPDLLVAVAPEMDQGEKITPDEEATKDEPSPLAYVVKNLGTYKPMYFLYGGKPAEAKFQLSFKYRLLNPDGNWNKSLPWLSGFHLAYTQTSWWDMDAMSKPFKDSSYMPELFWLTDDLGFPYPDWIDSIGLRVGAQHESNGKAGDDSRSLNIAYIEPIVTFPLPWDFHLTVAPKVWTYIMDLSDNPDIANYRGYFDLRMTLGQKHGLQLTTNLRKGTASGKGSVQMDLTYPLAQLSNNNLGLYLQAQFFDGYAESLIDYNKAHTAVRLGVAVSRW